MLHIIDAISMEGVTSCPLTNSTAKTEEPQKPASQTPSPVPARMSTFLLLVIFLSSLLFPLIRILVAKRSPELNLMLLLVLSAIDTILAAIIFDPVSGFLSSFWFLVIVLFLSLLCNLMLLNHAAKESA
jgi:hypothetical protein